MSPTPTKVQRLMRLNAFHEERADDTLRIAMNEQMRAQENLALASAAIDRIGTWKTQRAGDAALDLTVYAAALELEQLAVAHADALQAELTQREQSTEQAKDALVKAVCATRVSTRRGAREASDAASKREKRTFDQTSDVWLNHRETRHD